MPNVSHPRMLRTPIDDARHVDVGQTGTRSSSFKDFTAQIPRSMVVVSYLDPIQETGARQIYQPHLSLNAPCQHNQHAPETLTT
ncbi:hypothetical protein AB1N83_011889 [Pleurotus pulmonarius]